MADRERKEKKPREKYEPPVLEKISVSKIQTTPLMSSGGGPLPD